MKHGGSCLDFIMYLFHCKWQHTVFIGSSKATWVFFRAKLSCLFLKFLSSSALSFLFNRRNLPSCIFNLFIRSSNKHFSKGLQVFRKLPHGDFAWTAIQLSQLHQRFSLKITVAFLYRLFPNDASFYMQQLVKSAT